MKDLFPWLSSRVENRDAQFDSNGGSSTAAWHQTGGDGSDSHIDERLALSLPAVYTCVSYIADKVSAFPVDVFRKGSSKPVKTPSLAWLAQPCTTMTGFDFWNIVCNSLLLHGNAFMLINRNTRGAVVELIPVHPEKVSITSDDLGINIFYTVGGETYRQGVGILHIKNLSIANSAWGISPITQNRRTLLMGVNAEQFGADFYKYGLNLSGVIELPAGPGKIDADEAERMRKQFSAKHSGSTGSSAVGVLTGGAQWKQITLSPADAQFLESRKYTAVQVANIFHVPAYMVDPSVTSTWGTGIAEQNQMLVDAALEPLATRIETAISTFLLPTNQYMKFNMDELLRGDLETRTKVLAQQIQNGLIAPNEGRERLNLEPDTNPGSNDLQLPLYIGSIADAKAKAAMDLELQKAQIEAAKQTGQPPGAQGGTN